MRRFLPSLFLWFLAASALAGDTIRPFPLPVIMALGVELYQRDKIASDGFDALFAAHPEAQKLPLRGWITQYDKTTRRVFFVQGAEGEPPALAYTLTFLPKGAPKIEDGHGAPLPEFVAKRYAARQAAIAAIKNFAPGRNYNFEVLDDPEIEGGYIVYGLASSKDADEVVIGGHYRVSVAEDGKTVKQVDALSRSFLVLSKRGAESKDLKPVALYMSHIVSDTPVETHVYLSILHRMPLYVGTSEHTAWKVQDGIISKAEAPK